MNSFGMGLVLSFTDNATSGMNRATQSFNRMSSMADGVVSSTSNLEASVTALSVLGMGMSMVGDSVANAGASIIETFSGIINKVTSVGTTMLYARNQMEALYGSAEKGAEQIQKISDYATTSIFNFEDLIPSVVALKSVGIEAFKEITTSSGKATANLLDYASDLAAFNPNMKNAYGKGINAAIGAMKEYIAEGNALSLKRGAGLDITGILGEAKGSTIEERTQQIADLIEKTNMLGLVSSLSGTATQNLSNMQDKLFQTIAMISDSGVYDTYTSLIQKLADYVFAIPKAELKSIAETISGALVTIMRPIGKVIDALLKFTDVVRKLFKEYPNFAKIVTVLIALSGVTMLVSGTLLKFAGSILVAVASFKYLLQGTKLGAMLMGVFRGGILVLIKSIFPLIALATVLYVAWDKNLLGFQDKIRKTAKLVVDAISLIVDAWDYKLSTENYKKADEEGLLPLINSFMMLKYYSEDFKNGFAKGFVSVMQGIADGINILSDKLKDVGLTLPTFLTSMTSLGDSMTAVGKEKDWEGIGNMIGKIMSLTIVIGAVVKVFGIITSIGKFLLPVIKIVGMAVGAIAAFLGLPAWLVGVIIAAVVALIAVIVKFRTQIADFFVGLWGHIVDIGKAIGSFFVGIWTSIIGFFSKIFAPIVRIFSKIVSIIKGVVRTIVNVFRTIVGVIKLIVLSIVLVWQKIWGLIEPYVTKFIDAVGSFITKVKDKVKIVVDAIKGFFGGIADGIALVFNGVVEFITPIVEWIQGVFEGILGFIDKIVNGVADFTGGIADWIGGKVDVVANMVGLSTGGYVKETGVAVLHPNEVVVNDDTTQKLKSFLDGNGRTKGALTNVDEADKNVDNSVVFESGSIVIHIASTSDADLEKTAEKLMNMIARKQQKRNMATRNTKRQVAY